MENNVPSLHPQRNKFLWLIGLLVILVIALVAVRYSVPKKDMKNTSGDGKSMDGDKMANNNPPGVTTKEVSKEQLPDKIPSNLPIETGAKVTQNYTSTNSSGDFQSTRVYESKKTIDENKRIYLDYLKNNGWKVVASLEESDNKVFTAVKGDLQMQLTINQSTASKTVMVEVTITAKPGVQ